MKIDPATGWPFFVDHGSRRTTWDDPRYYESEPHISASANSFQNHPGNPYPSKQERCHEIANFLPNHPPSIYYLPLDEKTPKSIVTESSVYPSNSVRTHIEPGNIRPLAMENSMNKPGQYASKSTVKEDISQDRHSTIDKGYLLRHGKEGDIAMSSTTVKQETVVTDPERFTVSEEFKLKYPEGRKIEEIMQKSTELEHQVSAYNGTVGTKDYVFIEESLMNILLLLDKVETHGNFEIRHIRKSAVCKIQQLLTTLESRAKGKMVTSNS